MPAARPQVVDPARIRRALDDVRDEPSFIHELLAATLDWPIVDGSATRVDEIGYQHRPHGAKTDAIDRKVLDIVELNLAGPQQLWGIFLLRFKDASVFDADRGMTGVLRELLRDLVPKRRAPDGRKTWDRPHLLFICTHDFTQFRFAHFKAPKEAGVQPKLAAFGWLAGSEAIRTVCEFNLSHLAWPKAGTPDADWADAWAQAFDVASVTKGFYEDYREEEETLRAAVAPFLSETDPKAEPVKTFTQSLLNRLMFLRFIERKGWLTPPGKAEASRDYLSDLYALGGVGKKSFYASRLRPLFFKGLAIEGEQSSDAIGRVPFLNGGLFEESDLDKKLAGADLDAALAPWLDAKAGLFYRYNFTVQESTPLDVEVAVDPEMLGKVFEELVTGRHESGSYYTPRNVVSFMCREALKGYLVDAAKLTADQAAAFVDKHEVGPLTMQQKRACIDALDHLKAVDPACGSGAYLLGLLHELVDLYRLLFDDSKRPGHRSIHDLKLRIISHNLYGVDIDRFATAIAMLRLWLSLSVDGDDALPLPNLKFKIKTGDSLIGPDPSAIPDLFRERLQRDADDLVARKDEYLNCHDASKAAKLAAIEVKEELLAKALQSEVGDDVIDWRIHFAEVFAGEATRATIDGKFTAMNRTPGVQQTFEVGGKRGGFDIVLANPPYIRQELIKDLKPALKKVYGPLFSGTADLYVFFYLRALQLLAPGGMLAFISSSKWLKAGYGKLLRSHLSRHASPAMLVDFGELPLFQTAATFPLICMCRKGDATPRAVVVSVDTLLPPYPDLRELVRIKGRASDLGDPIRGWDTSGSETAAINKMTAAGKALQEYCGGKLFSGIQTGGNEAFIINEGTRESLLKSDRNSSQVMRPVILGNDVRRWRVEPNPHWLLYIDWECDIDAYPAIRSHLEQFKSELSERPEHIAGRYEWWCLRRYAAEYVHLMNGPKIVFPDIGTHSRFSLDRTSRVLTDSAFMIAGDDLYLLGVLNSSPMWEYFKQTCAVIGSALQRGRVRLKRFYVENAPIPDAPAADRKAIAALAQKCLDAKGVGCEAWEREIDERVAALYGLDTKDIRRG